LVPASGVKISTRWFIDEPRRGLATPSSVIGPSPIRRQLLFVGEPKRRTSTVTGWSTVTVRRDVTLLVKNAVLPKPPATAAPAQFASFVHSPSPSTFHAPLPAYSKVDPHATSQPNAHAKRFISFPLST
jgi:hypothetical protein